MLTFDSLLGNDSLKQALRHALNGRFPQTILLTGAAGIGKLTAARVLTAALLCEGQTKPCGRCTACHKVEQNIHSDVMLIDEQDSEIKVETARAVRSACAVYPGDSDRRIVLIRHAQNMNLSAQNALLKLLEEPPSYAFFILMTENAGALLPTILSRCTKFSLAPLPTQTIYSVLKRQFPDKLDYDLQQTAAAAQGILGDALRLLSEDTGEAVQYASEILKALASKQELWIFRAAVRCDSLTRTQFSHVLDAVRTALRDAVLDTESQPLLPALRDRSHTLACSLSKRQLLSLYDWLGELDRRIDRNSGMALLTGCLAAGCYERIQS